MKWRLIVAFCGVLTMVLLAQDIPLRSYLRNVERDSRRAGLERDAFILAGKSENFLSGETDTDTSADLQNAANLYEQRDGARVVITDRNGALVVSTNRSDRAGEDYTNRPEIVEALAGRPAFGERRSTTAGSLLFVAVPVLSGAEVVGAVRLTYPSSTIDDRADAKARGLLAVLAISLVAAILAASLLANYVVAPVRRLQRSTERLAAGNFSERAVDTEGPPEVRSLARSFNAMTEQIARLVAQQTSFASDASHQLRTPLTALRLQLERAAATIESDPAAARERFDAASEETERLQRLVEGLLLIARSDGGATTTVRVDVSSFIAERAEAWSTLAAEQGVQLRSAPAPGLAVTAVPNAVEQILDNYVDNALAAARSGDTIDITAEHANDTVTIHVLDEGPGMPPEQMAKAFDRFWRAPEAPHGGSGIGLAVVRHLAHISGGTVALAPRPGGRGVDASVSLPMATTDETRRDSVN